jgi:hypothetical protein
VEVDFPYGHINGLRELEDEPADLTGEEPATLETLNAEYAKIEENYQDADELPDEIDQRLGEIEAARSVLEARTARLRSGRDRPGRRLRQHRRRSGAVVRPQLRAPGGRGNPPSSSRRTKYRAAERVTTNQGPMARSSVRSSPSVARRSSLLIRTRTTRSSRYWIGSSPSYRSSHAGIAQRTRKRSGSRLPSSAP